MHHQNWSKSYDDMVTRLKYWFQYLSSEPAPEWTLTERDLDSALGTSVILFVQADLWADV